MKTAAQMSFPFDLTPCGPVAEATARAAYLAGIAEKVDHDLDMYGEEDFNVADFDA